MKWTRGKGWLLLLLAVVLMFALVVPAVAGGKAITPKELEKVTLIHYASDDTMFGKPPIPPGKPAPPEPIEFDNTRYELAGWYWAEQALPVQFKLDPDNGPTGATGAMQGALDAWDEEIAVRLFDSVTTDPLVGPSLGEADLVNTISFRVLAGYPKALAMTIIWYDPSSGLAYDTDIIFNAKYTWAIDQDGEGTNFVLERKQYDVQNVGAHELGHVLGLDDLYLEEYGQLTMYGYSAAKETLKITPEAGDLAGMQALYGNYDLN